MRPNPWDVRLAVRTLSLAVVAVLIVFLVETITTERGVAPPGAERSIGLLPLIPIAAAIAAVISLSPSVSSGELRALAALGWGPWRARAGALVVAAALSVVAGASLGLSKNDVAALFPPPVTAGDFRVDPSSTTAVPVFSSQRRAVRVVNDVLERAGEPLPEPAPPRGTRLAAALAIAAAGLALSLYGAAPARRRAMGTLLVVASWTTAEVAAFQLAGAGRATPLGTLLPSVALLSYTLVEHRRARTLRPDEPWL